MNTDDRFSEQLMEILRNMDKCNDVWIDYHKSNHVGFSGKIKLFSLMLKVKHIEILSDIAQSLRVLSERE